jgi:subtilisin family serine protease
VNRKISGLLEKYPRSRGDNVAVAIVDSGIESGHPDLAGVQVDGVVIEDRFGRILMRNFDGEDAAGHGTACAGLVLRMAPHARLISCRVLNESLRSTSRALLAALGWLRTLPDLGVVNLSLGTPSKDFGLEIAHHVDALYARGIPVVSARGYEFQPDYPSAFGSPVSVTAAEVESVDDLLYYPDDVVEFGAKGFGLEVPWRGGERILVNGSSFAAPLVAGRIARFKAVSPGLRVWELKTLLYYQARGG